MESRTFPHLVVVGLVSAVLIALAPGNVGAEDWGWKKATTPDDVLNFIDGRPPYKGAKDVIKVTAANKGSFIEFIVFYRTGGTKGWGWKRATTVEDALNFLNGKPPYKPLKAAEVAAVNTASSNTEFYIFYKRK